jgi:hypothetical protein
MTTTAVKKPSGFKNRKRQKGLASIEAIPLLVIFVMLVAYCMGLFGAIHTGILHSISSRTYAFETFRNRANLLMFRENTAPDLSNLFHYGKKGVRYHSVSAEDAPPEGASDAFYVSRRPLSVGYPSADPGASQMDHMERIFTIQPRNQAVAVGPIWVMVGYGICLNAGCGL